MIAVQVKGSDPKVTWEIVGIYKAPNGDMRLLEKLAERNQIYGKKQRSISSLEVIAVCFMWIRMVTRKNLEGTTHF
jgi:hypothetical protein